MKVDRRSVVLSVTILCLLIFYLSLTYMAVSPSVSDEYQAFYIDENVDNWPPSFEYDLGACISFDSNDTGDAVTADGRVGGWYGGESWGRWSAGEHASLYVQTEEQSSTRWVMHVYARAITPPQETNQTVYISVDGERVGHLSVSNQGTHWYRVSLPTTELGNNQTANIGFDIETPIKPSEISESGDTRQLGIGVSSVVISRPGQLEDPASVCS